MAGFDPSKIQLQDIYTDAIEQTKETHVFGNGKMQAMVFPSVSYRGDTSPEIITKVKEYVASNTNIYVVNYYGSLEPLNTASWIKSSYSNKFAHDIYRNSSAPAGGIFPETQSSYDIRAPIFFVVPAGTWGQYRWVAELGGQYTNLTDEVTVKCQELALVPDNFSVADVARNDKATLRVLKYNHFGSLANTTVQLTRCYDYKGILFSNPPGGGEGNCWVVYSENKFLDSTYSESIQKVGCFVVYNAQNISIGQGDVTYHPSQYTTCGMPNSNQDLQISDSFTGLQITRYESNMDSCSDAANLSQGALLSAWNQGIPMVELDKTCISSVHYSFGEGFMSAKFSLQGFKVQDNFGNIVELYFDWDYGSSHLWKVNYCSVAYA